jgi:hypothetical protein
MITNENSPNNPEYIQAKIQRKKELVEELKARHRSLGEEPDHK